MANWRNRIIERKTMLASDLAVNPRNPKIHPAHQTEAIETVLEKFGIVDGLIAYHSERNGGALTVFDGHARRMIDPEQVWDVTVTDLTDEEVDELVLYFDPLAAMSKSHDELAAKLAEGVHGENESLKVLLDKFMAAGELSSKLDKGVKGITDGGKDIDRDLGNPSKKVKPVLYVDQVEVFEDAIFFTGKSNRGEAIMDICRFYLERNGPRGKKG